MEITEITSALYNWADADIKRSVFCIATEKINETEEVFNLSTSTAINCKLLPMTQALVDAMEKNDRLADLITRAFLQYTIENKPTDAIGVGYKISRKEGENE